MDWPTYKALADTPGVWSRWMLEQTLELLEHPTLASNSKHGFVVLQLRACLAQPPVPAPADHKGGSSLDMFPLVLERRHAALIVERVQLATQLGLTTSGTVKRGLGGFVAAWQEYLDSTDRAFGAE